MKNTIATVTTMLKNFIDDDPNTHLHVGEVMSLWTLCTAFHEAYSLYQVALNTTTDSELIDMLQKALQGSKDDTKNIEDFLLKEGVPLPKVSTKKPFSEPAAVPEGVKLNDDEIANLISVKIASSISYCGVALSQTIRTDVGLLIFKVQVSLMQYAVPFKNLMKQRGWLKTPPNYVPPGLPGN
ncbi:DUF3231 family protein [Cytobacillus purgationiresistens]|uniref:DUF3231 family protein n=1 Tax=Cytobacillus purgationiresistens TaxID=863449 RepID=A0ABU0ABR3_9BACI|nr:DUF3231 family protein [Cytobacillus purgationiresistens]MDQ0268691.1 hypothetical protein [Cytobacillus purgationiresistens]